MRSRKRSKTQAEEEEESTSMEPESQEKEESSTTVKFNVAGKLYEVSKSLLEGFPDTMLAEKASSSSSAPIFIDRDPDRFAFCLDYMRDDGNVYLPETVSKSAFLKDLKFLDFVNVEETKISDEKSQQNCMTRSMDIVEAMKLQIVQMEKEAKTLASDLERKKREIGMQKVALKCRAASVECTTDKFIVDFQDVEGVRCSICNDPYFKKCCDKLGLLIEGGWFGNPQVQISRKTNICASKSGARSVIFKSTRTNY